MKRRRYTLKPGTRVIIVLAILVYFSFTFIKQEFIIEDQYAKMDSLNAEIAQVEGQNDDLKRQISYSKSQKYIEKMAREKLGWVKEGEIVFIEDKK